MDPTTFAQSPEKEGVGERGGVFVVDQAILPLSDLNPRLRCSAPAPLPPPTYTVPWSMDDGRLLLVFVRRAQIPRVPPPSSKDNTTPSLSSPTPEHPALLLSQLLARHQGRPVGILLHLGNCEIEYPPNWGRARARGTVTATVTGRFFTTAQHRIEPRQKRGRIRSPCSTALAVAESYHELFALGPGQWPLRRVAIGFPLPGPAITSLGCCGLLRWQGCPHCPGPSSCRTPTPGPSSRVVGGSVRPHGVSMQAKSTRTLEMREFTPKYRLVGCSASRVFTWTRLRLS
ncbi:hypothetical protein QBC39DRAFT_61552 [Podospora conica]|nr:hypothetical protein QBC39DRAFT_61552 [Schizothecium conicum]